MLALIRSIHVKYKGSYGSPRMVDELREMGFPAGKERVERLMRENGIRVRHKRLFKATTDSKHSLPVAENQLRLCSILTLSVNPMGGIYIERVKVAQELLAIAVEQGDIKTALATDHQLCEPGGHYRKSVKVKGDLTVNVPMSETKKFIVSALAKIRGGK